MIVTVMLGCMHTVDVSDRVHLERIACKYCAGNEQTIVYRFPPVWRIRCGHCTYSRGYGTAPLAASHAARKHHDKMGHDVMVIRNGQVEYTLTGNGRRVAPALDDTPPF